MSRRLLTYICINTSGSMRGEQGVQAGVDGVNRLAAHGDGGVDTDVGKQASGPGVSCG